MIYVGKYYSDIAFSSHLFEFAILLYKPLYPCDNIEVIAFSEGTIIPMNLLNIEFAAFVASILESRIDSVKSCLFYDYRTAINVMHFCPSLKTKFIGSAENYITWLNNKTSARLWLSPRIQTPSICVLSGVECTYERLVHLFPEYTAFVIQRELSSGGKGTYILTSDNEGAVRGNLIGNECYLVSPMIPYAQSYNVHMFIATKWYWISPVSKQLDSLKTNNPIYIGSHFSKAYSDIDVTPLIIIAQHLQSIGFRGGCGIDFILNDNGFMFIECNNRLQGSSAMLDYIMQRNGLPSLYQLLVDAYDPYSFRDFNLLEIPSCTYITNERPVMYDCVLAQFHEIPMYRYWHLQRE